MAGHQRVLRLLLLLILASSTGPRAVADVASGVAWLSAQAQADGSYATANDGTNPFQATAQALLGLAAVGEVDLPSSQPALDFLAVEPYAGTAYAAARVLAFSAYGRPSAGQLEGLRRTANEIGVYAAFPGFSGTVLDSALALEAFSAAGVEPGAPAAQTVGWLLDRQRADGGWSLGVNASDVPVTAAVVRALSPYRDMLVSVSDALSAAQAFLLGRRTAAGGWGEDQATASVLLALLPWTPDAGLLQGDLEILRDHQQPGGSWGGDVYMTALALRALAVADERGGAAVPGPDIGAVKGRVLDVDTGEPVPGASITPEGVPGFEAVTGQDGRFFLGGLPAGEYSLYARKAGYIGSARIGMVREGEVADAGVLAMALAPTAASLDVRVRSSLTGAALPGATVVLTGSGDTYQGISGADGRALLEGIVPAAYQWSISLGGFGTVEGSAVLSAGVVSRLTLGMVAEGAYPDEAPVDLTGRAVDGETGAPLPGALASLDSGPGVGADANGYFVLSDAQRGSHELRLEAPGYTDRLYELDLPPGAGGALGDLPLFAGSAVDLPDSLTLRGRVVDGITGEPVAGALVEPSLGGGPIETDGEGAFDLAGITAQELVLAISAQGHSSRQFTVSVEVFGDVSLTFRLPPQTESPPALASSSIEGTVRDTETGLPLAGARVALDDGSTAVLSGADGAFRLEGIQALSFSVEITALGYGAARYAVELKQHGTYSLPVALDPLPVEPGDGPTEPRLQVLSVESVQGSAGAHGEVRVRAWIGNLEEQTETVQVLAEVVDALGRTVAYVDPVVPGTDSARPELTLGPSETRQLELRWPTAQHPPGAYRFLVRAIEPGSRTAGLPAGRVYAEAEGSVEVEATAAFAGYASLDPPIAQAGQDSPVALSALLVNSGNVPLINPAFRLEVKDPESGVVLAASTSVVPEMVVGAHRELDFGYWVPTQAGDLEVTIVEANGLADGVVEGALHVGDRPVGAFTIAPEVVAEGTHTVRGRIDLRGVDVTQGTVTDPLFLAVRDAVERGGVYVAREAVGWQKRNRCQGCHIQTQSLLGLSSSFEKAPIDREAAEFLYNGVTSALQASGALSDNRPHQLQTQTAFSAWALTEWPAADRTFRTQYLAARYLLGKRREAGDYSYWHLDQRSGWWNNDPANTFLVVKNLVDVLTTVDELDPSSLSGYRLESLGGDPAMASPRDLERGPDGRLYTVTSDGRIWAVDPGTGAASVHASGLGTDGYGLAVAPDGTMYVAGRNGRLVRVHPDGSWHVLPVLVPSARDIELGPDGRLYVSDYNNHRILRFFPDDTTAEVWAAGGLLSRPWGLAFADDGSLYVANYNDFNVVRVDETGSAHVFADGLSFRPLYLAFGEGDRLYYSSEARTRDSLSTPDGLNLVRPDGTVERLVRADGAAGVAAGTQGMLVAGDSTRLISRLVEAPLDLGELSAMRSQILRASRYFLHQADTYTGSSIIQRAMTLSGLGETLEVVDDPALAAQMETAMAGLADYLRATQRADGGWGRYTGSGSDPLVTSLAGLALEYTHPSPDDPQMRAAVGYLLGKQRADGSWRSGIMSTRLAATSLVMDYLPKALDRLGGIDVDLRLGLPDDIVLSNPTRLPDSAADPAGGAAHHWRLLGVTSDGRSIGFDLTFRGMALHEVRPAARSAVLEFENSFTGEVLSLPLDIPELRVDTGLAVEVATDRTDYGAAEPVEITGAIVNEGSGPASGTLQLGIYPAGGGDPVAVLEPVVYGDLDSGGRRAYAADWNTGTTLVGDFEVRALLLNDQGRMVDEACSALAVIAPSAVLGAGVATDMRVYEPWDRVLVDGRLFNQSANAVQPPLRVTVRVRGPAGAVLAEDILEVGELAPRAEEHLQVAVDLEDAPEGIHQVELIAADALSREPLAAVAAGFEVAQRRPGLTAGIYVDAREVDLGEDQGCTVELSPAGSAAVPDQPVRLLVVRGDTQAVVHATEERVSVPAGAKSLVRTSLSTADLEEGGYACVAQAAYEGAWHTLGHAGFEVVLRYRIEGSLAVDPEGGRLLVLMDEGFPAGGDPHDPPAAPTAPEAQRAFLEALLSGAGWSYTITSEEQGFLRELRTGGYTRYALLAEHVRLGEETTRELREAVYLGEGLLVAGVHDRRNRALEEILGLEVKGAVPKAEAVVLEDSDLHPADAAELATGSKVVKVEPMSAAVVGAYRPAGNVQPSDSAEPAVTVQDHGRGRSVFVGFDLLSEAALEGQQGLFAHLLLGALDYIQPEPGQWRPGDVIPLLLTLENLGIDAEGEVALPIPEDVGVVDPGVAAVGEGELVWPFELTEGDGAQHGFWLRPAAAVATLRLEAQILIERGSETIEHALLPFTLDLSPRPTFADALDRLDLLAAADPATYADARARVQAAYLALHAGELANALSEGLAAADGLAGIEGDAAADARLLLAAAIRWLEMQIAQGAADEPGPD